MEVATNLSHDNGELARKLADYSARIGLIPSDMHSIQSIPEEGALELLRRIQVAHSYSVPFENLSVHAGEKIGMDIDSVFDKIVKRRRGGFCYEQNTLMHWVLQTLGYDVAVLSSQVWRAQLSQFGTPFEHCGLLVSLHKKQYLVDVGYPKNSGEPLQIEHQLEQKTDAGLFRLSKLPAPLGESPDSSDFLFEAYRSGEWVREYRFNTSPRKWEEFQEMLDWTQTSPDSIFTSGRIVSLLCRCPEGGVGRVTVADRKLIITSPDGTREERVLNAGKEYSEALFQYFSMPMDDIEIQPGENPLYGSGTIVNLSC